MTDKMNIGKYLAVSRQPLSFLLIGGVQYCLDALLFAVLLQLQVELSLAYLAARISVAVLGFYLNRRITFRVVPVSHASNRFGQAHALFRFCLWWSFCSAAGVYLLGWVDHTLAGAMFWELLVAKLIVEAVLVISSFFVYKYWVYR